MTKEAKTYLFEEHYTPDSLDDYITTKEIKDMLKGIVKSGNIQGYCFTGPAGCGKTTAAVLACEMIGVEYSVECVSEDTGVEWVRTVLKSKAKSAPLKGNFKVMILDEADWLSPNSFAALRTIINKTQKYCRWILTANYRERLMNAVSGSRLIEKRFNFTQDQILKEIAPHMWRRILQVCRDEDIKIENPKTLQKYMVKRLPDIRGILKGIQYLAQTYDNKIPKDIPIDIQTINIDSFKKLMSSCQHEDFIQFTYKFTQREIARFILANLMKLVDTPEKRIKIIQRVSHYQGQMKGIEEIHTTAMLYSIQGIMSS